MGDVGPVCTLNLEDIPHADPRHQGVPSVVMCAKAECSSLPSLAQALGRQLLGPWPHQPSPLGGELLGLAASRPAPSVSLVAARAWGGFYRWEGTVSSGFYYRGWLVPGKVEEEDQMTCLRFVFSWRRLSYLMAGPEIRVWGQFPGIGFPSRTAAPADAPAAARSWEVASLCLPSRWT